MSTSWAIDLYAPCGAGRPAWLHIVWCHLVPPQVVSSYVTSSRTTSRIMGMVHRLGFKEPRRLRGVTSALGWLLTVKAEVEQKVSSSMSGSCTHRPKSGGRFPTRSLWNLCQYEELKVLWVFEVWSLSASQGVNFYTYSRGLGVCGLLMIADVVGDRLVRSMRCEPTCIAPYHVVSYHCLRNLTHLYYTT